MADSVRKQIMDRIEAVLKTIVADGTYESTVAYVSQSLPVSVEEIDLDKLPACFPIDTDEEHSGFEIFGGSTNDMQSELTVVVTCVVFDQHDDTRAARCNLIRDVEKAIMNDTTLAGLALLVLPGRVTTDKGMIPNYSVWDQEIKITYQYSHESGG